MTYEDIIETVSAIVENEVIYKEGLVLEYRLPTREHKKMDEHLFYKANDRNAVHIHNDIILIEMGDIKVRILQQEEK